MTYIRKMKELIYISLIPLLPLFLICLLHAFWYCYLYFKKTNINIDLPPSYNDIVLCEKQLPKYKDIE